MAKRWVVGGLWAVLMAAALLTSGRNAAAEQPRTPKKVFISDVIISGNRRMSTEQIKAHLRTQTGQVYDPGIAAEDVRQLYNLNQFSAIQTLIQGDGDGKAKVYFALREIPNKVQKVTFLGAKHIKEEELRNITGVKAGMPLSTNLNLQGCVRILDKYEEMGRPSTQCTLVKGGDWDDTEVVYQITEGPKVKVREIRFTGNTFVTSNRLATQLNSSKEWFSLVGGTYNKAMAEADKQELMKYYRRYGYQDVQVSLETQHSTDGSSVTLIYHIHEGLRYRIQDVPDITGGTQIVPREQLVALSQLKPGDGPDEDKIKAEEKVIERPPARVSQIFIMDNTRKTENVILHQGPFFESPIVKYGKIGKIRVTGNKRISTESILAHVPLVPGKIFSSADLREAEEDLAVLDLFVVDKATGVRPTVTVIDMEGHSDRKDLLITVREKTKAKVKSAKRP